ncbi:MAG: amidohydrolase family protein [Thermoplasmata archaeon]|nr:amidohydrolase family protein [Thermoplasmata archaeon]
MLVEGAIVDLDGARPGYVRLRGTQVVETGQIGTDSSHGTERRVHGIVVPAPVNSHTHLGDSGFQREPPRGRLAEVVGAPGGAKFRYLSETKARAKAAGAREALRRMAREGTAGVIDFREEGLAGVRLLRRAAGKLPLDLRILGRPLRRPIDPAELGALLDISDGVGLSSAREEDRETRRAIASACRERGKRYALHASEESREDPAEFLDPHPDLLVHLLSATEEDLGAVAREGVPVAVCPRSNALFGQAPDLAAFERSGVTTLLGTDNGMLNAPSLFRELEFAYVSQRLRHRGVSPGFLVKAAFLSPWAWLGRPEVARVAPGHDGPKLIFRLPADDPEYALVARATEQLIVRPESPRPA